MARIAATLKDDIYKNTGRQKLAKLANALEALRECMRYVESTHGARGDLVGCAVNYNEYEWWKKLTEDIS